MALTLLEGFRNGGDLLHALADASEIDSDGGATITIKEIGVILSTIGISLIGDVIDNEPETEPQGDPPTE